MCGEKICPEKTERFSDLGVATGIYGYGEGLERIDGGNGEIVIGYGEES